VAEAILVVRPPYLNFIVQESYLLHDEKQAEATPVAIKAATLGVRLVIVLNPASAEAASPVILSKEVGSEFRSA
jgi:hypothetical protein